MDREEVSQAGYGVGIEWAESIEESIIESLERISLIEVIPENFFRGRRADFLAHLKHEGIPTMVHGVELSIGTGRPLKQTHLDEMLRVADQVNMVNLSDHLCLTEVEGVEIGQLTPIPFTYEAADIVSRNIEKIQSQIQVPFLIENITNRFKIPYNEMSETDFFNLILRRTGCSLLLDLNNVHTNAVNYHFDPFEWIDQINLSSVEAIHLAGGFYDDEGTLVDSHSAICPDRVWELYRYVCQRIQPKCTIVEWTDETPPLETLLGEVDKARFILDTLAPTSEIKPQTRPVVLANWGLR